MVFMKRIHRKTVEPERGHELARLGAVDHALGLVGDHLDQDLHGSLKARRHAGSGFLCRTVEQVDGEHAQQDGVEERIEIEYREVDDVLLRPA